MKLFNRSAFVMSIAVVGPFWLGLFAGGVSIVIMHDFSVILGLAAIVFCAVVGVKVFREPMKHSQLLESYFLAGIIVATLVGVVMVVKETLRAN